MWRAINRSLAFGLGVMLIAMPAAAEDKSHPPLPRGDPSLWFTNTDYPPEARRAKQQGRVEVEVIVDKGGSVKECRILTSSGSAALDAQTCELVRKRGRFDPATSKRGNPVYGVYTMSTRWVLSESDNTKRIPLDQPWHVASTISVDSVGKVLSCKEDNSQPGVWTPYPCFSVNTLPVWYAMYTRTGISGAAPIDVTFEAGIAASGATPPGMLAAKPGRTVLATLVMRLDVGADGVVTSCKVVKDSGTSGWADPCKRKVGPFAPSAKAGVLDITLNVSRAGG